MADLEWHWIISAMHLFCFGFGYSATALAARFAGRPNVTVSGTRTRAVPPRIAAFQGDAHSTDVVAQLQNATHVLVSIPPAAAGCPVLRHFETDLAAAAEVQWVGYLSTVGVYGDAGGAGVDETTPLKPTSERALRRAEAERGWLAFGAATGKRTEIFRLPGIYGPGRCALDAVRDGSARRMIKPGQVFNRVHVADIAGALEAAMLTPTAYRVYNVTDNEPAPPQDVITFAADLLGVTPPPETPFDPARLSPMAASFYAENKRVSNARMMSALGYRLRYPTYREGLRSILADGG